MKFNLVERYNGITSTLPLTADDVIQLRIFLADYRRSPVCKVTVKGLQKKNHRWSKVPKTYQLIGTVVNKTESSRPDAWVYRWTFRVPVAYISEVVSLDFHFGSVVRSFPTSHLVRRGDYFNIHYSMEDICPQ